MYMSISEKQYNVFALLEQLGKELTEDCANQIIEAILREGGLAAVPIANGWHDRARAILARLPPEEQKLITILTGDPELIDIAMRSNLISLTCAQTLKLIADTRSFLSLVTMLDHPSVNENTISNAWRISRMGVTGDNRGSALHVSSILALKADKSLTSEQLRQWAKTRTVRPTV